MSENGESGRKFTKTLIKRAIKPRDNHIELNAKSLSKGNNHIEINIISFENFGSLPITEETLKIKWNLSRSAGQASSSSYPFGDPSKNVKYETIKCNPQERSGELKILSRMDRAKKPVKANIQGVGLHTL